MGPDTIIHLQGPQADSRLRFFSSLPDTIIHLQGPQALEPIFFLNNSPDTIIHLQGPQAEMLIHVLTNSLIPLFTYKVLKHVMTNPNVLSP